MGRDGRVGWLNGLLFLAGACAVPKGPVARVNEVRTYAHATPGAAHSVYTDYGSSTAAPAPETVGQTAAGDDAAGTQASAGGPSVVIDSPGVPYRFELRFERMFDDDAAYFECDSGPVMLRVTSRDDAAFVQELHFDQICMARDANGAPLLNNARPYDDQGMLQIGDFDFDGALDLAVQDGRDSCYDGPSYHVFLFDRKRQRFTSNEAFTSLAREWCGFFDVDPVKQELRTSMKSGCCWHSFVRWKVVKGVPQRVYRLTVQYTAGPGDDEVTVVESEERFERGRWVERVSQKVEKQ